MLSSKWLCGAAIVLVSAATEGSASATGQFTTFDPKGSIYTAPAGINGSGTVVGYYLDSSYNAHGFVRASDGTITSIDPKGSTFTKATGINDTGEIAGWYRDGSGTYYSFVRAANGTITKFNPNNGNEPGTLGINANGNVTGWYTVNGDQEAGFVGAPGGKITQLPVAGIAINTKGAVTGTDGPKGFVRSPLGKMVTFTAPGNPSLTIPTSINDSGVVTGNGATICGRSQGFARDAHGTLVSIAPPNAVFSDVGGVNNKDVMTGYYYYGAYHGFVRGAGGAYTTFDVSGAADTYPQSINVNGEVTGSYLDSKNVQHGFVGTP